MKNRTIKQPFLPIYDQNSKILILGSFPSVISRKNKFYYTNPQNRFWKVLDFLFNESFYDSDSHQKTLLLKQYGIALFDVVMTCQITGSSDKDLKKIVFADIYPILNEAPIRQIFLNGKTAYDLFLKKYPELKNQCQYLPSTSSANAQYRLEDLIEKWKIINDYLN